jgi:AmmeMemoRadiSam system protein B/AmmeMemoRadiSam system protein A
MSSVRPAVLSGTWYPGHPDELRATIDRFLRGAEPQRRPAGRARVAVAPHAGYSYSGATAGKVYGLLAGSRPRRVFILAPSHRTPLARITLTDDSAFATPLGDVPVDTDLVAELAAADPFTIDAGAHREEHAVEIQLPFLQRALENGFRIVPALVPPLEPARRRAAAARLAGACDGDDLVVVSTDFTHYGATYGYVPFRDEIPTRLEQLDTGAILRILEHDAEGLLQYGRETGITMCGIHAAALALTAPPPAGYEAELLDYRRSADAGGDWRLSVSYAAILVAAAVSTRAERALLLEIAYDSAAAAARGEPPPDPRALARERGVALEPLLGRPRGAFVTLTRGGRLRGCIGYVDPIKPLIDAVADNARSAAVADPRFPALTEAELDELRIEISILTEPRAIDGPQSIDIGRHGIVLAKYGRRAVFLPQVAREQGWDRKTTLTQLALKAGLPHDGWKSGAEFAIFEAEILGEPSD